MKTLLGIIALLLISCQSKTEQNANVHIESRADGLYIADCSFYTIFLAEVVGTSLTSSLLIFSDDRCENLVGYIKGDESGSNTIDFESNTIKNTATNETDSFMVKKNEIMIGELYLKRDSSFLSLPKDIEISYGGTLDLVYKKVDGDLIAEGVFNYAVDGPDYFSYSLYIICPESIDSFEGIIPYREVFDASKSRQELSFKVPKSAVGCYYDAVAKAGEVFVNLETNNELILVPDEINP